MADCRNWTPPWRACGVGAICCIYVCLSVSLCCTYSFMLTIPGYCPMYSSRELQSDEIIVENRFLEWNGGGCGIPRKKKSSWECSVLNNGRITLLNWYLCGKIKIHFYRKNWWKLMIESKCIKVLVLSLSETLETCEYVIVHGFKSVWASETSNATIEWLNISHEVPHFAFNHSTCSCHSLSEQDSKRRYNEKVQISPSSLLKSAGNSFLIKSDH